MGHNFHLEWMYKLDCIDNHIIFGLIGVLRFSTSAISCLVLVPILTILITSAPCPRHLQCCCVKWHLMKRCESAYDSLSACVDNDNLNKASTVFVLFTLLLFEMALNGNFYPTIISFKNNFLCML